MSIYEFEVKEISGKIINLSQYKGKVLLIVNTATHCGFTPQYEGLQKVYDKYRLRGLEILDFPCNQFAGQAPEKDEEIAAFCSLKYHTTFKTFAKINVNGDKALSLYKHLKDLAPGLEGASIKWNFTKFLISKDGEIIKRFGSPVKPEAIEKDIEALL